MVIGVLRRIPESRELNRERWGSVCFDRLRGSGAGFDGINLGGSWRRK
jgi:hypothetical protein